MWKQKQVSTTALWKEHLRILSLLSSVCTRYGLATAIYVVCVLCLVFFIRSFILVSWAILTMVLFVMSAIAVLWIDFVREIRWCWEESERLPRMKSTSSIDLSACLIHQKLQMVLVLISFKSLFNEFFPRRRISSLCPWANVALLCCPVYTDIVWNRWLSLCHIHGLFILLVTLASKILPPSSNKWTYRNFKTNYGVE